MSKTKSVILLCVLLALILFLGTFAFLPEVDMGIYTYHSPINLTTKGQDVGDGVYVIYDISRQDNVLAPGEPATGENADKIEFETALNQTISTMRKRLDGYGYPDATISYDNYRITIYFPNSNNTTNIATVLGMSGNFVLSTKTTVDGKITDYKNITDCKITYLSSDDTYYISIVFDDAGKEALKKATVDAATTNVTLYFLMDGEQYFNRTASEVFDSNVMYLQTTDEAEARKLSVILNNGAYDLTLKQYEAGYVSPQIGSTNGLWLIIAIISIAIIVAFIIVYGLQGLASSISLVCFLVATAITSGLVFMSQLTLSGVAGILVGIAMFGLTNVLILSKSQQQARLINEPITQKRFIIATGRGFRGALLPTILTHAFVLVASIIVWLSTVGAVQSFGIALTYATVYSALASLFVTKLFSRLFISICPNNEKMHRLIGEVKE